MLVTPIATETSDGSLVALKIGHVYEVLGIEADSYRVLTDADHPWCPNDPVLYEPGIFQILDATEPGFWINRIGEEGERYAYPSEWLGPGFFEQYHDRAPQIQDQFLSDLERLYPTTWTRSHGSNK